MNPTRRQLLSLLTLAPMAHAFAGPDWPDRAIRWIVPFAPGGSTDVFSRVSAERLSRPLGQAVVVENVSGAAGVIGMDRLHRSAPDGYTVGTVPNSLLTMSPYVTEQTLPYNTLSGFTPISGIATFQYAVEVHPTSRIKSLADLIEIGRKEPGKLSFGTTGAGTGSQLAAVLLTQKTGAKFTEIPYKSGAEYTNALLANQVDFIIDPIGGSIGLVREGKLRALATTGARRSALLPDIAPIADTLPGFDHLGWFGLYGPARFPKEIADRCYAEMVRIQQTDSFVAALAKLGYENMPSNSAELQARTRAEFEQWGTILKTPPRFAGA